MDVRKRKGSKTNLTTGKKSSKYRKVTLDENLSPDVLSNPDISLEPVQNEHETDLNQSQNENNSVDVVTYAEIGLQTYRIPSVDTSIQWLYFILVGMTTELYRVNFEICLPIFVVDFKVNEMANSCWHVCCSSQIFVHLE